jgi:exportin-1
MFSLVEVGRITVALGPSHDNTLYVQEFVASLLRTAFPHPSDNQIKITVQGLFNLDQDIPAFKEHLRDFLVQIRVRHLCRVLHGVLCHCQILTETEIC